MRRREFIKFAICASLTDLRSANAQETSRVRRIGVLMGIGNDTEGQARLTALTEGLRNAGWIIGTNLQLDIRWGAADAQMTKVMAREILDGHPDVTLAANTVSVAMLLEEKSATPIVFVSVFDPIDAKFVSNLARPGGRITGFTNHERSMGGKWLQILKEIEPSFAEAHLLYNPKTAPYTDSFSSQSLAPAAVSQGISVSFMD
jgi:putative ABC transport system substrate-binding protein